MFKTSWSDIITGIEQGCKRNVFIRRLHYTTWLGNSCSIPSKFYIFVLIHEEYGVNFIIKIA
jgi:hypothetical protein